MHAEMISEKMIYGTKICSDISVNYGIYIYIYIYIYVFDTVKYLISNVKNKVICLLLHVYYILRGLQ